MTKQIDDLMRLIGRLENACDVGDAKGVDEFRGRIRSALEAALKPGEPDTSIEQIATDRYKVVPSHESMFHRFAVVAGNGKQQLYLGREVECESMARKFAGAFLDGAFVQAGMAAPPAQTGEVVAMRGDFDGYGYQYIDSGSGSDWRERHPDWEPLCAATTAQTPPPRLTAKEITDLYLQAEEEHIGSSFVSWREAVDRDIEAAVRRQFGVQE